MQHRVQKVTHDVLNFWMLRDVERMSPGDGFLEFDELFRTEQPWGESSTILLSYLVLLVVRNEFNIAAKIAFDQVRINVI
jgi:hypothetical protein